MKKFISREDAWWVITIAVLAVFTIAFFGYLIGWTISYNQWYNNLTPEEQADVQAEEQARYDADVHSYEVLSVNQYVRTDTNLYGVFSTLIFVTRSLTWMEMAILSLLKDSNILNMG